MKFTVVKKGYDTNEVDGCFAEAEASLAKYREMEEAISNSIISAEIAKARIIRQAEEKAEKIIEGAKVEVAEQVEAIRKMLECEKRALEDFCEEYDGIVKTYFTAGAAEITAPLKEKMMMIEYILDEQNKPGEPDVNVEETAEKDPFGEIQNYF